VQPESMLVLWGFWKIAETLSTPGALRPLLFPSLEYTRKTSPGTGAENGQLQPNAATSCLWRR
jgi:hypothetical protein